MISINLSGDSIQIVAEEARQFADFVLGGNQSQAKSPIVEKGMEHKSGSDSGAGYQPPGVGSPKYYPVDDGSEWGEDEVKDWIQQLRPDGRRVVQVLAQRKVIDPRKEADNLGWNHIKWAGVWTGPRRQAGVIWDTHGVHSWPYGHSYEEPRRLWMHEDIASTVLDVLKELEG